MWAIWNETVVKRPWKAYQSDFYELEQEKASRDYKTALAAFNQADVQGKYKEAKKKLEAAGATVELK